MKLAPLDREHAGLFPRLEKESGEPLREPPWLIGESSGDTDGAELIGDSVDRPPVPGDICQTPSIFSVINRDLPDTGDNRVRYSQSQAFFWYEAHSSLQYSQKVHQDDQDDWCVVEHTMAAAQDSFPSDPAVQYSFKATPQRQVVPCAAAVTRVARHRDPDSSVTCLMSYSS